MKIKKGDWFTAELIHNESIPLGELRDFTKSNKFSIEQYLQTTGNVVIMRKFNEVYLFAPACLIEADPRCLLIVKKPERYFRTIPDYADVFKNICTQLNNMINESQNF